MASNLCIACFLSFKFRVARLFAALPKAKAESGRGQAAAVSAVWGLAFKTGTMS